MHRILGLLLICLITLKNVFAQNYGSFKDTRDGKVYQSVKIGNQEWMAENLNTDRFRNGDLIPEAKTDEEWVYALKFKEPAWCYYNNNKELGLKFGKLYNYYAVTDTRGLAPIGWHVPVFEDWETLSSFLKKDVYTGSKLKAKNGWNRNGNGTNVSGFSALPGGERNGIGIFWRFGDMGTWWSDDYFNGHHVNGRTFDLTRHNSGVSYSFFGSQNGYSVRCLKGESLFSKFTPGINKTIKTLNTKDQPFTDKRNNKIYKVVKIGEQEWMAENLFTSTFNNGDTIMEAKTDQEWHFASENKIPAWCYSNNDLSKGKLYNWFAVNDQRGLAPLGWHIPDNEDWKKVEIFLGGEGEAGIKLKSRNGWDEFGFGSNFSGFNGLPDGQRSSSGKFYDNGKEGYWWSLSEYNEYSAWYRSLHYSGDDFINYYEVKGYGFSVRCIKD